MRSICVGVVAVATSPVGASGTVASVVALATLDARLTPIRLIAETR